MSAVATNMDNMSMLVVDTIPSVLVLHRNSCTYMAD